MSPGIALLLALALLAGNAFFVGAEFAVVSARRSSIEPKAAAGSRRARTAIFAMEHVSEMLACAQLGVTVCSIGLGAIAEPAVAHLIEIPMHAVGAPAALSHALGFTIALALVVYLHVLLGEMVPKNLSVAAPDRAALIFAPPLVWLARILSPIIRALNWVANHVVRLARLQPKDEVVSTFTAEEVASIVKLSQAEGLLNDDEGLLAGALEFSEKLARDVMVPIGALVTVPQTVTPHDLEQCVARTGYSRFPVEQDGDLAGYLHVKDVLYATGEDRDQPVPRWRIRRMAQVPPDAEIEDVLVAMQRRATHLARVGTHDAPLGVVFMEDILEELVGEVRDSMQR